MPQLRKEIILSQPEKEQIQKYFELTGQDDKESPITRLIQYVEKIMKDSYDIGYEEALRVVYGNRGIQNEHTEY